MEVITQSGMMSTLNPNAPMFVPQKYRAVEDFSEQWWALVHSSPWFRDYWLQECFLDPSSSFDDPIFLPDDLDDEFYYVDELYPNQHKEEQRGKELVTVAMLRWQKGRALAQAPKYAEKAPKIVKLKVSPRPIHQPM